MADFQTISDIDAIVRISAFSDVRLHSRQRPLWGGKAALRGVQKVGTIHGSVDHEDRDLAAFNKIDKA